MNNHCGDYYKNYDMSGDIHIGTGIVRVHDIFNPLPEFMFDADVIFTDLPYNQSTLSSYYTKAELKEKKLFSDFIDAFFKRVREINPKLVILETGTEQAPYLIEKLEGTFKIVRQKDAFYYKKFPCKILYASNEAISDVIVDMPVQDEEKDIEYVCKNLDFKCIGDLCMGKGLVAFYANKYGKKFVGTELNKYRLGVCCERVTKNKRGIG